VALDDLYDGLADRGLEYGPAFQGLRAVWRRGDEVFAEVSLPEDQRTQAGLFGLHPALLDAALHAALTGAEMGEGDAAVRLPFSWNEVCLYASGATALRVRLSPADGGAIALELTDEGGAPVASVQSLSTRPVSRSQLDSASGRRDSLYRLEWVAPAPGGEISRGPLVALGDADAALAETPGVDVLHTLPIAASSDDVAAAASACAQEVLALVQEWLADERFLHSRLVLVTGGAVAVRRGEPVPGLAQAPVWGLVRSAQLEHPGRLVLIDLDGEPASREALGAALASGEQQLAVCEGVVLVPRLAPMPAPAAAGQAAGDQVGESPTSDDPATEEAPAGGARGTVLITGGTGDLGGLVARRLASEPWVSHVLLLSRRGREAAGAQELEAELLAAGVQVTVAACDAADRGALAEVIGSIPAEHPLRAVVHAAGALDDGVIDTLTPAQLERTLAPKVAGAWHLHELTEHLDLAEFVLFSSTAGTLGSAGQANYGAANAFLDALAAQRRSLGLAGVSMAWGLWAQALGMTAELSDADRRRLARSGTAALSVAEGLELFAAARAADEALAVPLRLDVAALRAQARAGVLPPLLRGLVRMPARGLGDGASGSLARRLAGVPEGERERVALELVCAEVAIVLGHASADAIDERRAFKELGFDSLTAVELRNRLAAASGLRLPSTLVFDYPTPLALTGYLLREVAGRGHAIATSSATAVDEPIAIVGISCRLPGGVRSAAELWELVAAGGDGIGAFPTDRGWDLRGLYDPDPDHPGSTYVNEGGFLYDAGEFDAGFFQISPREALAMDPQQRLLLEGSWEALEDAGIDPLSLRGSQTGVFAGAMNHDYHKGVPAASDFSAGHQLTDGGGSVISGRVAYALGLEGPAMTVDTACSSSLVALHLACGALRAGECSLALAGGVSVMATPEVFLGFSRQRALARDGRCKSFAEGADGAGFSEGMGVLALERLSDAGRLGHRVLALVRGSAVNQDGASNGLTAPNGPSQQRVIAQALANAGLSAEQVDAVEAHGTGTALGDPIEAQALLAAYGQDRPEGRPLWLGSIKSNIGHTQAAAGVAGVIKMVMGMRHGVLPRTLHVDEPTHEVDWSAGAVALLTDSRPWPVNGQPRRAGVSSFGASGTNAHVVIEQAPALEGAPMQGDASGGAPAVVDGVVPWVLSGRGVEGLRGQAGRLREFVEADPELGLADVGLSLAVGRAVFEERAVVVGGGREGLLEGLGALAGGESAAGVVRGVADMGAGRGIGGGGVVFLFGGQGSQWPGMAVELLDASPVFAEELRLCDEALGEFVDWSAVDVLRGSDGAPGLERVDVVQPLLFAVMVSLAGLWRACGVQPGVVVGHSQGEIAAAHVAGGLSLRDAARLVVARSRALVGLMGRGGMVSVALGEEEARGWLGRWDGGVSVAAVNGPGSVVVSGERVALDGLLGELVDGGVRAREIPVGYASHSAQIEEIRGELLEGCAGIAPVSGGVPFFSTVTGELMDTALLDGEYWYRNLRETVQLERVTRSLLEQGYRAFVEVGPHPVLSIGVQESVEAVLGEPREALVVGSLRREQGGLERFLLSLGEA